MQRETSKFDLWLRTPCCVLLTGELLGKPNKLQGMTHHGLASRPGGVEILLATSCHRNLDELSGSYESVGSKAWLFLCTMIPVILRTVDPIPDHPKGQKLLITLSRPLEWHSKHTRCKLYIIDQLRLKLFVHISYLVLHYPQNFATQPFIWKSAIFQIFANITSQRLIGFQNVLLIF